MPRQHNETVYLWLDDLRTPPNDKWIWCKNAPAMWELLRTYDRVDASIVLSLDHDLGETSEGIPLQTGYDLLNQIEKAIATDPEFTPDIVFYIHSANPVGRINMNRAIEAIYNLVERKHQGHL